ncbi:hypothetical protein AB0G73_01705 [Streptomyces sp. NPDC020719]|uniref:hypothetical protein n=1 Tax=unclassified Streptomyces TaxID=2593676 RepID=UPI0033D1C7E2
MAGRTDRTPPEQDAIEPQSVSRSAYLRLLALQRTGGPNEPLADGAGQEQRERLAIVDGLRPAERMWPDYPDFWVEGPRTGDGWHERFLDKGPRRTGLAARRQGPEPAPRRQRVTEAYLRLKSALGAGTA